MDKEATVRKLFFDDKIQFVIPPYQRAYSWGAIKDSENDRQAIQFIDDLREQKKRYYFGHFLFERNKEDDSTFIVIDGQQRITTVVIFFSCLLKILSDRESAGSKIIDKHGEPVELWRTKETFLQIGKRRKFKTVSYDDNYFESLILKHNIGLIANTDSKHKIYNAYSYFIEVLKQEDTVEILRWKDTIENAVVTTFEVTDKIQATQIFGFQNDRGKNLTDLEKLKAFLMYQIYLESEDVNSFDAIAYVEREFAEIYELTERLEKLDEDQVLAHYSTAFLQGWEVPLKNVKRELTLRDNKEQWIKDFCTNLKNTFRNVELVEKKANENSFVADVLILDAPNSWPLLLKIHHFHSGSPSTDQIEHVIRLMEIALFKKDFAHSSYQKNSFNEVAKHYQGDFVALDNHLSHLSKQGFQWYWTLNANCMKYLQGTFHYDKLTRYLLWKYENNLRLTAKTHSISASEFINKFGARNLDNTLEHVAPQNPESNNYDEKFKNECLNNVGNLVLMSLGRNAQLNNDDPLDKAGRFQESTLISQQKIGNTIKLNSNWGPKEIKERQDLIIEFAIDYWKIVSTN